MRYQTWVGRFEKEPKITFGNEKTKQQQPQNLVIRHSGGESNAELDTAEKEFMIW